MKVPFRQYLFGEDARAALMEGVDVLYKSVVCTLGARGRNAIIESDIFARPIVTNDGVTIAREGNLQDPAQNVGMQIVKQASFKSNEMAGDGTTTAIVLARAIIKEAFAIVEKKGVNVVKLKKEIEASVKQLLSLIEEKVKKITTKKELQEIATVSCRDSVLGEMIGGLMFDLGLDSGVLIEETPQLKGVAVEKINGMLIKQGIKEGVLTDAGRWECKFDGGDVRVLVSADPINDLNKQFLPFMRQLWERRQMPDQSVRDEMKVSKLIIIAEDVSAAVLQFLFQNGQIMPWAWIQPPSYGETRAENLKDLAAYIGATYVDKKEGRYLKDVKLADLGTAEMVLAKRDHTIILPTPASADASLDRANSIRELINVEQDEVNRKSLEHRLANLTGSVAVIRFNANTDVEKKELKYRVEDAMHASKSALQEGIVAGGGVALMNAAHELLKDDTDDVATVVRAMAQAPIKAILYNAGVDDVDKVVDELKSLDGIGIDVYTDTKVNMVEAGVIDPYKVLRCAVENGLSAAVSVIMTECVVTRIPDEDEKLAKKV